MLKWFTRGSALLDKISDTVLITRSKRGDAKAFGSLYLKYLNGVYRYVFFRIGQNGPEAEDISQNALIRAWEKIGLYKATLGSFRSWLFSIVHNTMIDYLREKGHPTETLDENNTDISSDITDSLSAKLTIDKGLEKLPAEQRSVITLRFIEGYSVRETAKVLGKTEEGVRAMQYRALKTLREIMI